MRWRRGSFRFPLARVKMLSPIETAGLTVTGVVALRDRTRAVIAEASRVHLRVRSPENPLCHPSVGLDRGPGAVRSSLELMPRSGWESGRVLAEDSVVVRLCGAGLGLGLASHNGLG